jgi:hypothetical protein
MNFRMYFYEAAVACVFSAVVLVGSTGAAVAEDAPPGPLDFQSTPHTLSAADIFEDSVLSGPNYKINDVVMNDGLINTYDVETVYGAIRVETTSMLQIRLNELDAIVRMEQLKGTSVYGDAAKKAGKSPFTAAKDLVLSPIDTTKNVVSGVGRWFSDVGRAAVSSDPHQEGVFKTAVGHAAVQRQFAVEFGVDPYTSFEPLATELNDVAWTATGGGLTVKVAFTLIPGGAGTAVRTTSFAGGMKNLVRDNSPGQVNKILKETLATLGIEDDLIKEFLGNNHYSPQERALLVGYLEEMKDVADLRLLLSAADTARDESIAVFNRIRIGHMARLAKEKNVTRALLAAGAPFIETADGEVIGVFPLDYLLWTNELSMREKSVSTSLANLTKATTKHFLVTGTVHPIARRGLEAAGWTVTDHL